MSSPWSNLSKKNSYDDWCNECLRFLILREELVDCGPSHYCQMRLKMSEQNDLTLEGFLCNSNLLSLDLPSLKRIDLCQCRLTRIEKKLFSNLPNLESLYLSLNELVVLDKDLFKNLIALRKLNLSDNNIAKSE